MPAGCNHSDDLVPPAWSCAPQMALAASVGAPIDSSTAARSPPRSAPPSAPAAQAQTQTQTQPAPPSQAPPAQPTSLRKARSSRSSRSGASSSHSSEADYLAESFSPEPSYQEPPPAVQSETPVVRDTAVPRLPAQPHILGVRRSYINQAAAVAAAATQAPVQLPAYVLMPVTLAAAPAAPVTATSHLQAEASSASTASHLVTQSAPQSTAVLAPHWQLLPTVAAYGVPGTPFVGIPPRHALSASLPSITSQATSARGTPTRTVPTATAVAPTVSETKSPGGSDTWS
jgi:hypothetical protein